MWILDLAKCVRPEEIGERSTDLRKYVSITKNEIVMSDTEKGMVLEESSNSRDYSNQMR